jgi:FtsP/CotA-like multicopper oxidase with cupredoxin domain
MPCSILKVVVGLVLFASVSVLGQTTRTFKLSLTEGSWSPNGNARQMILVNGQFPGPNLQVWQGDEVAVVVENNLNNSTSIHFHG